MRLIVNIVILVLTIAALRWAASHFDGVEDVVVVGYLIGGVHMYIVTLVGALFNERP